MPVIPLLLRLIGVCGVTFALLMAGLRVLPYDDGGLQAALFAPDCTPPCFMGIHPGVTTRREAVRLLQAHPWVAAVSERAGYGIVSWTWNGSQRASEDQQFNLLIVRTKLSCFTY